MANPSKRWTATATLLLALSGCTSFIGRATAPDERPELGLDELGIRDFGPAPSGPKGIVHVESRDPASLVELERNGGVIGRCTAPCDRSLSLDGCASDASPSYASSLGKSVDTLTSRHARSSVSRDSSVRSARA